MKEVNLLKNMIFGCSLMLGGVIGLVGWSIACSATVQHGAVSSVFSAINTVDEYFVFILFLLMLISGIIYSIKTIRE